MNEIHATKENSMYIYTAEGFKPFYTPEYRLPAAIVNLERQWRDAWNTSATEFNTLVERTQAQYGRMMDVKPLKLIPPGEVKIPD
jgi:hypothetical protein